MAKRLFKETRQKVTIDKSICNGDTIVPPQTYILKSVDYDVHCGKRETQEG